MIFSTKNNEIAILGKTINDVRNELIKFDSIKMNGAKISSKKDFVNVLPEIISPEDASTIVDNLNKIRNNVNESYTSFDDYFKKLDIDGQSSVRNYVKENQNQIYTTEGVIASSQAARDVQIAQNTAIEQSTLAYKAAAVAKNAFAIAGNMIVFALISKGIELATTAVSNWIHRVENANKAMDEAVSEYKSAQTELKNINSELDKQNKRIDELLAKDKLTYVEKGELDELQKITKELLIQQDIEAKKAEAASKESAQKAVEAYDKSYGDYDITKDNLVEQLEMQKLDNISRLPQNQNDVTGNISAYLRSTELLADAQEKYNEAVANGEDTTWQEKDVQYYIDLQDAYNNSLDNNISDLQNKKLALQDEYKKAIEQRDNGFAPLTTSQNETIEAYEKVSNAIRLIYEYTDPSKWNSMQVLDIFNIDGIEKTKEELVELSRSSELSPETIESFTNLNNAFEDCDIILTDGKTKVQAFCDVLDTLAVKEVDMKPIQPFSDVFNSSDFQEAKEQLMNLSISGELSADTLSSTEEYKSLIDQTGLSAEELVDKINEFTFDSILVSIEELTTALDKTKNGELFSSEEIAALIMQHSELASSVIQTADGYTIESSAIESLISAYGDNERAMLLYQMNITQSAIEGTKARIEQYQTELEVLLEMAGVIGDFDSYGEMLGTVNGSEQAAKSKYGKDIVDKAKEMSAAKTRLKVLEKKLQNSTEKVASLNASNPKSPGSASAPKEEQPKEFDWLKTKEEYLQKEHDNIQKILDDETQSYEDQLDAIDNLIAKDKERLDASTKALTIYQEKWEEASAKLSQEDIANIQHGNDFIGEHKGQYAKDLQEVADIYKAQKDYE